jgi:hypothetical protein
MAMRLRRKIGWALAALLGLMLAAYAAAPHLVDVEAYKPALIAAVKEATGRELVIEGPMKLSMFPEPRISARRVHFANAVGAKGAQMVDVRWIGASPSWWALLRGKVEIGSLILYKPTIVLETDAEGRPNWEFAPGAGASQPAGAPSAGLHLAIGRLRILQGTLSYANPSTGKTLTAEQIDATASVGSLDGPLSLAGTATVNGVPLSLDVDVGGPTAGGNAMTLKLKVQSGTLDFDGRVSRISSDADVRGKLSVATGELTDFIATVVRATGQAQPTFDAPVVGNFTFDGGIEVSAQRVALSDFRMSMAGETVSGSLALTGGPAPALEGRLSLPRVDVEAWLALLAEPALFQPSPVAPKGAAPKAPEQHRSLSPFPPELGISLSLDAAEVFYRRQAVRDLTLTVEIRKGVIVVPRMSAILPGDMVVRANAAAVTAAAQTKPATNAVQSSGEISLTGPRLRDTLAWLGIDTSGVPAGRLQSLTLEGRLAATANSLKLSEFTIDVDGQHGTGSGSVTFGTPLASVASIQFERFDLDAYMPLPQSDPSTSTAAPATSPSTTATPNTATLNTATLAGPTDKNAPLFGLKAKVGKLVYRGETLNGVDADLGVQGNFLKLNGVKVADLLGAKLDLRGQVADFGTSPRFDVTFNATMPDTDKLLDYAGLPRFLNGRIGASTTSGAVAGTMQALNLRDAAVTALGTTVRAGGMLVLGEKFRFDLSNFALQTRDGSGLLSVATGRKQTGIGALSATGSFKGSTERATFDGKLIALGTQMSGSIDAILGERPNITANLRIPDTVDFDTWLGVSAGPTPAAGSAAAVAPAATPSQVPVSPPRVSTDEAIDLSALRAFDATLTLETTAIAVASLKVTYADLQATLHNGVFAIGKLTGQFYGGAVDFAGTIDASRAAMSVDLRGSLQGIYLGEMLRGAAGTNIFGNEHLTVAVDGKISIMNIAVQGQGNSLEQIRDSLAGSGQVSGYVYPSVVSGSLGFVTFAAGVASIFSTEMGFNSAVLQAFINGQNPISGELALSGGTLALRNHTVQGQNAIARIDSRTSLAAATTDTTIALDTGARGPADYVVTVKGPVSSPTMNTRGSAN